MVNVSLELRSLSRLNTDFTGWIGRIFAGYLRGRASSRRQSEVVLRRTVYKTVWRRGPLWWIQYRMNALRSKRLSIGVAYLLIGVIVSPLGHAQEMMVYPAKGQSQEQQSKDRYECNGWAVSQSGFDPSRPPPPAYAPPPQSTAFGGATRGAAVGAVGGAIGGNAGKGAAIGAATGALVGGIRRRNEARQQAEIQSQQNYAVAGQSSAYSRALAACLQGRGYTVN
jgi:hypothetical protein